MQTGLSARFDIHLLGPYSKFSIMDPQNAVKIDDPTEYVFQTCLASNVWVDLIIVTPQVLDSGLWANVGTVASSIHRRGSKI